MSDLFALQMDSPLGTLQLLASDLGLCGVWFENQRHGPSLQTQAQWQPAPDHAWLNLTREQLNAYFAGQRQSFDLPLDLTRGTAFQQSVWHALLSVPCGGHESYAQLAQRLDRPKAVRAVGSAVGRNPISIIVPCHRILGAAGQLTGYAGGLERKQRLLQLEGHTRFAP